ncbi:putative transporterc [Vanrija pseudolonga]|uniref:Purtative transporterc n=1 Tax=Vanrija pseudolonga TaxID=143232 RepID=A0AAF0YDH7_9TREE|nr:purtative transporterc [Vanrija pseudolonga]
MSYEPDKKDNTSIAVSEAGDDHLAVHLPASLQNLSEEERAALAKSGTRKVDLMLLPCLTLLYLLNFLDRQNLSSAKIAGISKSLHLTTQQYATAVAVLFAGYVALQIPSNMIASKVRLPGLYICVNAGLWGIVSACTAAVHDHVGLSVCRAMLGAVEAAFFPGAIFLVSLFYTRREMAFRAAAFYTGSQIGNAFGGLFAIGILKLDGKHGLEGWRWLFIVEGAMTLGVAVLCGFIIPNRPESVRWLTPVERDMLLWRLESDHGTKDENDEVSIGRALKMAVLDPKTWLMALTLQFAFIAATVTNFFPIVVAGLGFDRTTTLAITAPPYILCAIGLLVNGWSSDRLHNRSYHIAVPMCFTLVGNIIAVSTTKIAPRYFAMCLLPVGFYCASTIILSWIGANITGPSSKRAITLALVNALAQIPNIWSSYLYYSPPRFIPAFMVDLVACALAIAMALLTRWYFVRENKKMDEGKDLGKYGPSEVQLAAGYRYQL